MGYLVAKPVAMTEDLAETIDYKDISALIPRLVKIFIFFLRDL
jgi:hypothetical protein